MIFYCLMFNFNTLNILSDKIRDENSRYPCCNDLLIIAYLIIYHLKHLNTAIVRKISSIIERLNKT